MKLKLRAKHFHRTPFLATNENNRKCAIEKAISELIPKKKVVEAITCVHIENRSYIHEWYGPNEFDSDKIKAKKAGWGDKVIRKINIPKLKITKHGNILDII